MRTFRGHRKDANHNEIKAVFDQAGFSTWDTYQLGKGFPDIIVAKHQKTALIEIKDGSAVPSARKLTMDEIGFHAKWRGLIHVISTVDEAVNLIQSWGH